MELIAYNLVIAWNARFDRLCRLQMEMMLRMVNCLDWKVFRLGAAISFVFSLYAISTQAKSADLFIEQKITLPFNVTQPVKAANLLPNPGVELIVVGVNKTQQRQIAILAKPEQGGQYQQVALLDIDNEVFAYDFGEENEQGISKLYLLTKSSIQQYVPTEKGTSAQWIQAQQVSSFYLGAFSDVLVQQDFARDINDDQQDDFVLPHFEEFNFWLSSCCEVNHHLSLPIPARFERRWDKVSYSQEKLYFQDINQDQKTDIVAVELGRLLVFSQTDNKQFETQPYYIPIDSNTSGLEWWDSRDENGQQLNQSDLSHKKVEAIRDINGDQLPDLAVKSTQSSGVLDKNIEYQFYYGQMADAGFVFSPQVSSNISHSGTLSDLRFIDLEEDGKLEVTVSSFDIGISQIIGALLSGSIDQEAMIFSMDENNLFGKKPIVEQDVEMTFSLSSGKSGEPLVKVADVNGDKVKDLVFSDGTEQIRVLLATPMEKRPFAKRALRQKITLPKNASQIALQDLNDDQKADLVLHYGSTDGEDMMKQILVLLVK